MNSFDYLKKICNLETNEYVISNTLKKYEEDLQAWKKIIANLKYIFVGDNPGDVEKERKEYFCYDGNKSSQTGINTHNFIENFLKLKKDEILFLNKSLKPTTSTEKLYVFSPLEDKSLVLTAQLIQAVADENTNVFVCIFGLDSFKAEYFESFFNNLSLDENIGLYPHPSRRQPISIKEQENFANGYDKQKVFRIYGQLRYSNETKSLIERCEEEYKKSKK